MLGAFGWTGLLLAAAAGLAACLILPAAVGAARPAGQAAPTGAVRADGADRPLSDRSLPDESGRREAVLAALARTAGDITVELRRIHLCGTELRTLGRYNGRDAASLLRRHPEWKEPQTANGRLRADEIVDDWPAGCRGAAYFRMDKEGNLSLFDGPAARDNVLRTFFQMDVRYMESSLPPARMDELARGIPVTGIDELNSVLSTFSDFALEPGDGAGRDSLQTLAPDLPPSGAAAKGSGGR